MDEDSTTAAGEPALFAGAAWFDPIEAGLRGRIRGFIEELVEQELTAHPSVLECAVIARPHPKWSEAAHAFIVPARGANVAPGPASDQMHAALQDHCRARMSGFAVPKWFTFINELPKSSTGSASLKQYHTNRQRCRSARCATASRNYSEP